MEAVSYTSINGTYTKVPCTLEDIDNDVSTVKDILKAQGETLEHEPEYIDNMIQSIYQDRAFGIYRNGKRLGFIYNRLDDELFPNKLIASALVVPKDIIALTILILSINLGSFSRLIVFPHGRNLQSFKSFITKNSLRIYNSGLRPYVNISKRERNIGAIRKIVKICKIKKVRK